MRNALEAMHYDGRLTVRTCRADNDQVEIQIEDSGPGVPEHLRPLLFQQPVTTRGKEGGGLGLLFVRSTIETIGGTVRLLPTRHGPGSVFAVKLPRKHDLAGKEC
jgi:signal transduction histidine kinase